MADIANSGRGDKGWYVAVGAYNQITYNANPCYIYYQLPVLPAGDHWTQGWLTAYISSNSTNTFGTNIRGNFIHTGTPNRENPPDYSYGGDVAYIGGPAGTPVSTGTFFPDLRTPPTQGVAVGISIDLSQISPYGGPTVPVLQTLNDWITWGRHDLMPQTVGGGMPTVPGGYTFNFWTEIQLPAGSPHWDTGPIMTIYNPTLFLYSALTYTPITPLSGGDNAFRRMLPIWHV